MRIHALTVAAVAATLALAACSAPAQPEPDPAPDGGIPSIAGEWVLTRTVTETTGGAGYAVGDTEQRYLLIGEGDCTASTCTGDLVTSNDESVFDGGEGTTLGYHWDGTTFSYDPQSTSYDCSDADDTVLIAGAYDVTFDVSMDAVDTVPSGFAGSIRLTLTTADGMADQVASEGCPAGGDTVFDATLDKR